MDLGSEDVARLIAVGEGKELEFKRGLASDEKVARTLGAFANTRGGILLVGVGDRGETFGAPHPGTSIARLHELAKSALEPRLAIEAGSVVLDGRRIVWCSVPISPVRPHAVPGADGERAILVRVGAQNRAAGEAALARIAAERSSGARLDPLQSEVIAWIEDRTRAAGASEPDTTVARFAAECGVGIQRARRAFLALELAGRLVGHGPRPGRRHRLP